MSGFIQQFINKDLPPHSLQVSVHSNQKKIICVSANVLKYLRSFPTWNCLEIFIAWPQHLTQYFGSSFTHSALPMCYLSIKLLVYLQRVKFVFSGKTRPLGPLLCLPKANTKTPSSWNLSRSLPRTVVCESMLTESSTFILGTQLI